MKSTRYQAIRRGCCSVAVTDGAKPGDRVRCLCFATGGSRLKIAKSPRRVPRSNINMLAVQKSAKQLNKCHPNLLPCKINHNGSVDASDRYWKPLDDNGES